MKMANYMRFVLLMTTLFIGCITAEAYDFIVGGIAYNKNSDVGFSVTVTNHTGYSNMTNINIPSSVTYQNISYRVTCIGISAFLGCNNLENVSIPNSVLSIYDSAFEGCTGLNSVKIPDSVTEIYENAFNGCSGMTSLTIGSSVGIIGENAFSNCTSLNTLNYNAESCADFIVSFYRHPFINTNNISTINIGNNVQRIPAYFASDFKKITSVVIPNAVTEIGYNAFNGCSGLTTVTIGKSVTSIGSYTFSGCTSLETLNYNAISYIDTSTTLTTNIFDNTTISTINIGNNVQRIPKYFAGNLTKLTSINIPNSVTEIASWAFAGCTGLTSLTFGSSVNTIGGSAFSNCTGLTSVNIPNSVSTIGANAFANCTGLKSVTIGKSVTEIGNTAFKGLSLNTLNFNAISCADFNSTAEKQPFYYTSISTINIGANVKKIPAYFAQGKGIRTITIPKSVSSIGTYAFYECNYLNTVNYNAESCADFTSYVFYKTNISTINIGNNVQRIPAKFAGYLTKLTNIYIPNSVTEIASWAFAECTGLKTATIGSSVNTIGERAFYNCTSIDTLNYNAVSCADFTSANYQQPFYGTHISTIIIGDNVQRIPAYFATDGCYYLSRINCKPIEPPIMASSNCFEYTHYRHALLVVPNNSVDKYKTTSYWNNFEYIYGADDQGNILVNELYLDATYKQLHINDSFKLTATVLPEIAPNRTIVWTNSNPSIASVNNDGTVTAISTGSTTITALTTDGSNLSASCFVSVSSVPVSSISLNKTNLSLDLSDTYQLIASIYPSDATNKTVIWESSNTAVATVSSTGLVSPISAGTAIITATTTDGTNLSASCQVNVIRKVTGITLNYSNITLTVPQTTQLTAHITPSNATNQTLNWTSSNNSVATVNNNGLVTSKAAGTATIKATTTDGSNINASCNVTVRVQPVTAITLNTNNLVLESGQTFQLMAQVEPENASNKTTTWTSSDINVATVDSEGKVTAKSEGNTTIKAIAADGSGVYATCVVQVLPDYYIEMDTLMHVRGSAKVIVDFPISLINKNAISAIQFDIVLPDCISFKEDGGVPDMWLDDNRKTRSHNLSVTKIGNNSCRVVIASTNNKELKGHEGAFVHMNLELHKMHDIGNFNIQVSNIIAAEADETRHILNTAYSKVNCYYIVGDANSDASVDIADFNATGSKILLKNPNPFFSDAADVDNNSSIDVADLVGITNIAIGIKPISYRQAPHWNNREDHITCQICQMHNLNTGEDNEIVVGLDCGFDFSGFQMDLMLPDGLTLVEAYLNDDASGLGLAIANLPNGSVRLLGASFTDAIISGICPEFLTLRLNANDSYSFNERVIIDNIIFAERDMTSHNFDNSHIEFIEPSWLYEKDNSTQIYAHDRSIVIDTPVGGIVQLVSLDGRQLEYEVSTGHNVIDVNIQGIFIVKFNEKTLKILL